MKKALLLLALFALASFVALDTSEHVEQAPELEETDMKTIQITTNKGSFTMQLYADTPISTNNFVSLVEEGFYNGLSFHRYEPGFVIQGGDPSGDGTGGSSQTIELEIVSGHSHSRGTVGMARSNDPNSASSQFFVNLADNKFLDEGYAVFGEVTEGMDIVDSLRAGDVMEKVEVLA